MNINGNRMNSPAFGAVLIQTNENNNKIIDSAFKTFNGIIPHNKVLAHLGGDPKAVIYHETEIPGFIAIVKGLLTDSKILKNLRAHGIKGTIVPDGKIGRVLSKKI